MKLIIIKNFLTVFLTIFIFTLIFISPVKGVEVCQCSDTNYGSAESCSRNGSKWTCKNMCTTDGKSNYDVGFSFCYSSASELRTCRDDGTWQKTNCPNGCESGKRECTPESDPNSTGGSSSPNNSTSDDIIDLNAPGNFSGLGTITSGSMISTAVNIIYIIASITFFFILLFGGIKWITSSGDEKKLAAARTSITHGLIGLTIVFIAWALMRLISTVFGFDFTNLIIQPFYQE